MSKVLLLNDTSDWYHWGCTGTSQAIKEEILNRGYDLKSIPINYLATNACQPKYAADYQCEDFYNKACQENQELFAKISDSDIVVINGEGTIHHNNKAVNRLFYLSYIASTRLNKRVQIINHSSYPEVAREPKFIPIFQLYKIIYSTLDYVAIREHISHRLLSLMKIDCELSFDCLPLSIKKLAPEINKNKKDLILIAGSVSLTHQGVEELSKFIKQLNADSVKVGVLTGASDNMAKDDEAFLETLGKYNCEWENIKTNTLVEWCDAISTASILISGRFHHTIAAAFLNTPFILFNSNTLKNAALCETFKVQGPYSFDEPGLCDMLLKKIDNMQAHDVIEPEILNQLIVRANNNFKGLE